MTEESWDPKGEYVGRLMRHRAASEQLARRDGVLANVRLGVFLAGLAIGGMAFAYSGVAYAWIAVPVVVFLFLIVLHELTLRRKTRADGAIRFYERAVARLEGRWAGTGIQGAGLVPKDHLFAEDLDLFGEASLFELLCTARTRAGEEALASWLCAPAAPEEIRARQKAVEELRHRVDLREDLALLGGEVRATVRPELLVSWAAGDLVTFSTAARGGTIVLTVLAVLALFGWAFLGFGPSPLLLVIVGQLIFMRTLRGRIKKVISTIDEPARDLGILAVILKRLEEEPFESAKLVELQGILTAQNLSASMGIGRLHRLLRWLEQQRNQFFAPFAFILLWPAHFAFAIEGWRMANRGAVSGWLGAIGEFEALCALAAYAYEHPKDPFPEMAESSPVFDARGLGHPLIEAESCVRNDVVLAEEPRVLIVSGSNMSGKSTLLRTAGINAVLAQAGAPVCAESLRLSPLALGATLRIEDSIQSGTSRFYSEIKRLRRLMEVTEGPLPLLFLLDEILAGTNSHDRGIGADALIRGLLDAGAVGLITTHDLALTKTADALGKRVANVHFVDHLEGDRLVFDYRLQPGVVKKSNALALMRAIGLDV